MFEVYMNIIEWGPMVYGANEAIFLASIIPSPKRSLNSFTDDFQLKQEEAGIKPEVKVSGEAKRLIQNREKQKTEKENKNEDIYQ